MDSPSMHSYDAFMSRRILTALLTLLVVTGAVLTALSMPARAHAGSTAAGAAAGGPALGVGPVSAVGPLVADDSARKKRTKRRRLCTVKRLVGGRLVTLRVRRYAYKTVRRDGRRVRVIVRRRVALKVPCAKRCVVTLRGRIVYRRVTRKVRVPRRVRGRRVLVKRRLRVKVPKLRRCPKRAPGETVLGTPITIGLKDGSVGNLDFGAFIRHAPLTGSVRGFIEGRFDISQLKDDVTFTLTGGRINVQPVGIFIDDVCGGEVTAAIRTGSDTYAILDQSRESTGTLFAETGRIQSIVRLLLRAPLELRNGDEGCNQPYITTGYTQTPVRISLGGDLSFAGELGVDLKSGEQLLDEFDACLEPGTPTQPCGGFSIPFAFVLSTRVVATLGIGKYGRIVVP